MSADKREYQDLVHQLKQISERLFDLPKFLELCIRLVRWVQLSGHFPCQYFDLEKCNSAKGFKHMLEFQDSPRELRKCLNVAANTHFGIVLQPQL